MKKYRCVIVGCGPRSKEHARAYRLVDRGQLVACCDNNTLRLEEYSKEFNIRGYTDAAEMIKNEKPDLIHLVTPPFQRLELMRMVDDLGVPACLVEKPVACEVKDWQAMRDLESKTRTKFAVNQQVRYQPYLLKCRNAISSGELGKLLFVNFSAGMNIAGQGTHILDWASFLNNDEDIIRVYGAATGVDMTDINHPAPDTTVGQVVFANGIHGLWNNGYTAPRAIDDPAIWKHLRISGYCERGRVLFEEFGRTEIVSPSGMETELIANMDQWQNNNDIAQAGLVNSMFDWLEDDNSPSGTNLLKVLRQWNAILGLYASALSRKPIDIPFTPPEDLFKQLIDQLR